MAEANAAATTQPLIAFMCHLLTYCNENPKDTRAARHLQGFWAQGQAALYSLMQDAPALVSKLLMQDAKAHQVVSIQTGNTGIT